jgi:hypothetical protein
MAVTITPPLTTPINVTATLQAGGSLSENTTYYVRVTARNGNTYVWHGNGSRGICSLPSVEISFTTTDVNKSAKIDWTAVTGAYAYNVYCSPTSGDYYMKKCGAGVAANTCTTNTYTITSISAIGNPNDSFAIPATDYIPGGISKELANIWVDISGNTETLTTIKAAIDAAGYSGYCYYDGKMFVLKGGILITGTGVGYMEVKDSIIYILQGSIQNINPNFDLRFGVSSLGGTSGGCAFNFPYESALYPTYIKFYRCYFTSNLHLGRYYIWGNGGSLRMPSSVLNTEQIDCLYENMYMNAGGGVPINNISINASGYMYWDGESTSIKMHGSGYIYNSYTPYIRNWIWNVGTGNHYTQFFVGGNTLKIYDCTFTVGGVTTPDNLPIISWDKTANRVFEVYNSITLRTIDGLGRPIQNVNVELRDKNGDLVFSVVTNDNGYTNTIDVKRAILDWNGTGSGWGDYRTNRVLLNPFTLKISKSGYSTYQTVITLTSKVEWVIHLDEAPPDYDDCELVSLDITDCSLPGELDGSIEVTASGNGILAYAIEKL